MENDFHIARIVRWAQENGSDATTFRDAVHESYHAVDLGVSNWDREEIHLAVLRLRPAERAMHELAARAAEWLACERVGIPYNHKHWALIAACEAQRSHAGAPLDFWVDLIQRYREHDFVLRYVSSLFDL